MDFEYYYDTSSHKLYLNFTEKCKVSTHVLEKEIESILVIDPVFISVKLNKFCKIEFLGKNRMSLNSGVEMKVGRCIHFVSFKKYFLRDAFYTIN